jgi:pimeloyl-ACP methyl ester carboxylesterase
MPQTERNGVGLYSESVGDGPTVALLAEAGLGAWSWGWQHDALAGPFEALVADYRGTGRSDDAPPADVATLAADLEAVLRDAGARRAHLVGCGLGGAVALAYAREYGRARSLALVNAAASGDRVDADALGRLFGDDWTEVAFSSAYREVAPLDDIAGWRDLDDADPGSRDAQITALAEFDAGPLYEITTPALVLGAVDDPVVPVDAGCDLADGLPNGRFEAVAGRHLAHLEHAVPVNDAIVGFLEEQEGRSDQ